MRTPVCRFIFRRMCWTAQPKYCIYVIAKAPQIQRHGVGLGQSRHMLTKPFLHSFLVLSNRRVSHYVVTIETSACAIGWPPDWLHVDHVDVFKNRLLSLSLCAQAKFYRTLSSNRPGEAEILFDHSLRPLGQAGSHSLTERHWMFGTVCQQSYKHWQWTFFKSEYLKHLSNSPDSTKHFKLTLGDPV